MCIPKLDRHTQEKICKEMQLDVDNHMTDGHTTEDCDITDAISLLQTKMQVNKNPITWYHMLDKRNSAALMLCSTLTGMLPIHQCKCIHFLHTILCFQMLVCRDLIDFTV
ncbi:unnamed protein product [Trichobilharzia regenti]|nr:unnamed protein product [Trichobilharzia regenti]